MRKRTVAQPPGIQQSLARMPRGQLFRIDAHCDATYRRAGCQRPCQGIHLRAHEGELGEVCEGGRRERGPCPRGEHHLATLTMDAMAFLGRPEWVCALLSLFVSQLLCIVGGAKIGGGQTLGPADWHALATELDGPPRAGNSASTPITSRERHRVVSTIWLPARVPVRCPRPRSLTSGRLHDA